MNAVVSPSVAVPDLIARIMFALCQTVTARVRVGSVTQAQLTYVVGRLLGIRKRFLRLVARIRAGRPPRERARREPPARAAPEPEISRGFPPPPGWRRWAVRTEKPVPTWRSLRQHAFGWALPLAPAVLGICGSAAAHRADLLRLLAEPETRALLLASRRVGDSLRPLCWMLGIETSVLYPARPAARAAVPSHDAAEPAPFTARPARDEYGISAIATPLPDEPDVTEPVVTEPDVTESAGALPRAGPVGGWLRAPARRDR